MEAAELIMSQRRQQTVPESVAWIVVPACGEAVVAMRTRGAQDTPGVDGKACGESSTRNRRDPPRRPTFGAGGAYKLMAKGHRAERESEGLIVPLTGADQTLPEGRSPALIMLATGISARAWR